MERNDLPEVLFKKMNEVFNVYPNRIKAVERMMDHTGFFPGCKGLWLHVPSDDFPSILVLGHDFSNVEYYEGLLDGTNKDTDGSTWLNLISIFSDAGIDFSKCFFSNVIMGLRDTPEMTGKHPGYNDKAFMQKNLEFLAFQIETIKPQLIITMGQYATKMVGELSPIDLYSWSKFGQWKEISKDGNLLFKPKVKFDNHTFTCLAIEHTSFNSLNVIGKTYVNGKVIHNDLKAEVEMLKDAMALNSKSKTKVTAAIFNNTTTNTKTNSNVMAVSLVKQEFESQGFQVVPSSLSKVKASFSVIMGNDRTIKIKVRVVTAMGSYVFNEKTNFDVRDPDLYMALVYMPNGVAKSIIYLIPATAWTEDRLNNGLSIFKGYNYPPPKKSKPEWGITYSQKAKDKLDAFRFAHEIKRFV